MTSPAVPVVVGTRGDADMPKFPLPSAGNEVAIAHSIQALDWDKELRGAQFLYRSGLCPSGIKSPEAALFIILTGRDLGLSAVQSLRSIHIIQGKVELAADQQLALFKRRGGRATWLALTDTKGSLKLTHPNGDAHTEEFTIQDAQKAGLMDSTGWKKYPKAMIRSRCITAGLKSIGFDATAGMYDEAELGGEEVTERVEPVEVPEGSEVLDTSVPRETMAQPQDLEAPTQPQRELLTKIVKSHYFTDDEREDFRLRAEDCATAKQFSDLLDEVIEEGRKRKAAERQAAIAPTEQ